MNTIGDIRAKMTAILERKKIDYSADMANEIKSILLKNGKRGNKKQDLFGLRFGISGDVSKTENYIKKVILKDIEESNYTLSWAAPDKVKKGESQSGTFNTHKITVINPFKLGKYNTKSGDAVYIIDNLKAKSNIQNKQLTPDGLGLSGGQYNSVSKLIAHVERSLNVYVERENISMPHFEFMMDLLNDIIESTPKKYNSVLEVSGKSFEIPFKTTYEIEDRISSPDIAKIAKDFGEVLGGAYLLCLTGGGEKGLEFPYDSNEPLVDFYIDGQSISMKSGGGAAPSLSNIANMLSKDPLKWEKLMSSEDQKLMLRVVRTFNDYDAAIGMFKVAEMIDAPGWHYFKAAIGEGDLTGDRLDRNKLNNFVLRSFIETPDEAYDLFTTYYEKLGRFPENWENKEKQIEDAISRKYAFGLLSSPLAYHVKDMLNENPDMLEALSEVMHKFNVLQLYIDLKIGKTKKYQKYTLKPFEGGKFKFNATPSVNNPIRNKFSVKMVK